MRWTSRKLISAIACMWLFTHLLTTGALTGDQYVSIVTIIILAYFAGNVGEKFAK